MSTTLTDKQLKLILKGLSLLLKMHYGGYKESEVNAVGEELDREADAIPVEIPGVE